MPTQADNPALESFETTTRLSKTEKIRIATDYARSKKRGNQPGKLDLGIWARLEHQSICRGLADKGIAEPQQTADYFRAL